jgi:hypothetical protein
LLEAAKQSSRVLTEDELLALCAGVAPH